MPALRKYFTREFSLITCAAWDRANRVGLAEWVPWIGQEPMNLLFLRRPESPKITVWYEPRVFDRFLADVKRRSLADPTFFPRAADAYRERWAPLVAFMEGATPLSTIEDFQTAYKAMLQWWSCMPLMYVIAGFEDLPETVLREARDLRIVEERYADRLDGMFVEFVRQKAPRLRQAAEIVRPDEVARELGGGLGEEQHLRILRRAQGFAMLNGALLDLDDLDHALAKHGLTLEEEQMTGPITELNGQGVSPGRVSGIVRYIRGKADLASFCDGEILVTEMTHPDYVPAMRKAAAIVTDEGGITSHAAIVSREIGKPCVVGTKIATKALHDGDRVEVDAGRGVIRIRKKQT